MAKKRATKKRSTGKADVMLSKLTLDMPLDDKKLKQIERCLKRGKLKLTVKRVDLATGRFGDGWLYD